MKVVHLSISDISGGAAKSAFRLNAGLGLLGVDSKMLVAKKAGDSPAVESAGATKFQQGIALIRPRLDVLPLRLYPGHKAGPFSPAWVGIDIVENHLVQTADIVHLHWICAGYITEKLLKKFNKPLVWTLHDMWAFTGGCHYSGDCLKYLEKCGACPFLSSRKDSDLSRKIWMRKKRAYKDLDLTIVTPSRWLADCAGRSSLLKDFPIEVIPYGLDTDTFKPIDKKTARRILNIPEEGHLILFGGCDAVSDERKGFDHLAEALRIFHHTYSEFTDNVSLTIFGAGALPKGVSLPFKTRCLGRLNDEVSLALCYNAADVFVAPSRQDNLPNTVMESIACATPVAAFGVGGLPDLIDHKVSGYLAKPYEPEDLARGIYFILSGQIRPRARDEYGLEVQASRYVKLYERIVASQKRPAHILSQ